LLPDNRNRNYHPPPTPIVQAPTFVCERSFDKLKRLIPSLSILIAVIYYLGSIFSKLPTIWSWLGEKITKAAARKTQPDGWQDRLSLRPLPRVECLGNNTNPRYKKVLRQDSLTYLSRLDCLITIVTIWLALIEMLYHILLSYLFLYELYQLQTDEVIRKLLLDGYFALKCTVTTDLW
jgi:hypothetical protein